MRAFAFAFLLSFSACIDAQRLGPTAGADTSTTDTLIDTADTADTVLAEDEIAVANCTAPSRCSDSRLGIESCTAGTWTMTTVCAPTQLCVDVNGPYCIPASGAKSCYDQLRCAADCSGDDPSMSRDECVTLCYADTVATEQSALLAASECFGHLCGAVCETQGLAPASVECYTAVFDCVATNCADELATCDFGTAHVGSKPCGDIQSCGRDCNDGSASDQSDCTVECVQEGDRDAQRLYAVKDLCEYFVCLEARDNCSPSRLAYCTSYTNACHNDE